MRKKRGLPKIIWVGVALLGVSAALLTLGSRDNFPHPTTTSYSPSGTAAFAELLRRQGLNVSADLSAKPRLAPGDLAIAFTVDTPGVQEPGKPIPFADAAIEHLKAGGMVLLLPVPYEFSKQSLSSLRTKPIEVDAGSRTLSVSSANLPPAGRLIAEVKRQGQSIDAWKVGDEPYMVATRVGKGSALTLVNGIIATNRFIDREQNAEALVSLVRSLANRGGRVVFTEASFGNVRVKSLAESLGAWVNAAWQQILFLAVVIIYTLGRRLGLPEETRRRQRGTRELVDGVADTLNRARSTRTVLELALASANMELREALKLSTAEGAVMRDDRLPESLQVALARLQAALTEDRLSEDAALKLVQTVEAELQAFLGARRKHRRRQATIRG